MPRPANSSMETFGTQLHAANETVIPTYGTVTRVIDFGFRRAMRWTFWVADVAYPILGADALRHFNLIPDLNRHCLVDNVTGLEIKGTLGKGTLADIGLVDPAHPYYRMVKEFPRVLGSEPAAPLKDRGVQHRIETTDQPLCQRALRLVVGGEVQVREGVFSAYVRGGDL